MRWLEQPLPPIPSHHLLVKRADLYKALADGRKPMPHQRYGARWLLARRGALLADDMGLGKTLTVLLAARGFARSSNVRIIVIAPIGLHSHWLKEAIALNVPIELESWASLPKDLPDCGTLLIVDEAHFAQSLKAKRTKSLLRLARHPRLRAIWMLSGTPIKNGRPIQLYPLLAALGHPLTEDQEQYEKYFCNAHWGERSGKKIWNVEGASNLLELHRLIIPLILKRNKKKILGLPPKVRRYYPIALDSSARRGFNHRLSLVIDHYRDRVKRGLVNSEAESLAVLNSLRQISAEFKLCKVKLILLDLLAKGHSVVVFSSFVQPLLLLNQKFEGELLTGKQSLLEREKAVNKFQNGDSSLLLSTFAAGGLGYTLHRARHVILIERPWTPGEVEQAEDRCHRLGMAGELTCHWPQLGLVDELVDSLLDSKTKLIDIIIGNKNSQ